MAYTPLGTSRGPGTGCPHRPQEESTPFAPWFQTSGFQNDETVNFSLLSQLLCCCCWIIIALQCCRLFLLYNRVNQLYVYTYPFPPELPSHLCLHRCRWAPGAIWQPPTRCLVYTCSCICVIATPQVFPCSPSHSVFTCPQTSTSASLFQLCKQIHLCHFLESIYMLNVQ